MASSNWLSTIGIAVAAVVNVLWPDTAFGLMMSVAIFGAMFAWLMIFVTHLFFRARYRGAAPSFRMAWHPCGSLAVIGRMTAIMVRSEFRMTLVCGGGLIVLRVCVYLCGYRRDIR